MIRHTKLDYPKRYSNNKDKVLVALMYIEGDILEKSKDLNINIIRHCLDASLNHLIRLCEKYNCYDRESQRIIECLKFARSESNESLESFAKQLNFCKFLNDNNSSYAA